MFNFNQEHFEAWLFSQPRNRALLYHEGHYLSPTGCLMCNYLRDNNYKFYGVGGRFIYNKFDECEDFKFLQDYTLFNEDVTNIGIAQDIYQNIFGPVNHKDISIPESKQQLTLELTTH